MIIVNKMIPASEKAPTFASVVHFIIHPPLSLYPAKTAIHSWIVLFSDLLTGKAQKVFRFQGKILHKETEGIEKGNPIHYAGVEVGMVDNIAVKNGEAVLSMRFYNDAKIPKDAEFTIQTSSVMGGRFIKVSGGHQDRGYLQNGMTVEGVASPGIDQAMDKMDKLINSAQMMLNGINEIVADPNALN